MAKPSDEIEEARQWVITFYLVVAAAALASVVALMLAARYM